MTAVSRPSVRVECPGPPPQGKFTKRWVVIQENELRYYKQPADTVPRGVQGLAMLEIDKSSSIDSYIALQQVVLKNVDGRDFSLKAVPNEQPSFDVWVETLQAVLQAADEEFDAKFDLALEAHATHPDHFTDGVNLLFAEMMAGLVEPPADVANVKIAKLGDTDEPAPEVAGTGALEEVEAIKKKLTHAEKKERAMMMYTKRNELIKQNGEDIAADHDLLDAGEDYQLQEISFGRIGRTAGADSKT